MNRSSAGTSNHSSYNDNEESTLRLSSLYPSTFAVEAIAIPQCNDAFRAGAPLSRRPDPLPAMTSRTTNCSRLSSDNRPPEIPLGGATASSSSSWFRSQLMSKLKADTREDLPRAITMSSSSSSRLGPTTADHHHSTSCASQPIPLEEKMMKLQSETTSRRFEQPAAQHRLLELEVSPGVYLPLHGSKETFQAMQEGCLAETHCLICCASLYCVNVANFVLCPTCRVVSPVDTAPRDTRHHFDDGDRDGRRTGGVGLGMSAAEYDACEREQQLASRRQTFFY
jgi:hypothetical protein